MKRTWHNRLSAWLPRQSCMCPGFEPRWSYVGFSEKYPCLSLIGVTIGDHVNPLTAKLFNLNFHPLEIVSRWRDPQLQVSENYSDLTKWRSSVFKYCWFMSHFIFNMLKRWYLILLILNLPLSSSSTTSRELLSQFSTCSGWRWFDVA